MLPIDEITKKVLEIIPVNVQSIEEEIRQKIKLILQATLSKLDVVSREEFDVQTQVLAKTRAKVETLEKKVQAFLNKHQST